MSKLKSITGAEARAYVEALNWKSLMKLRDHLDAEIQSKCYQSGAKNEGLESAKSMIFRTENGRSFAVQGGHHKGYYVVEYAFDGNIHSSEIYVLDPHQHLNWSKVEGEYVDDDSVVLVNFDVLVEAIKLSNVDFQFNHIG